ncbi:hypothetical protein [Chitinophaga sp.]|uniref:hypothetical protein n=1 Tax=Chitinophaga sp. TaxID=1869181 RepID=UPI002F931756
MLIEVIFKGLFSTLDFSFLKKILPGAREVRFNFPEISFRRGYDEILNIVNSDTYIDLVINTDYLSIEGKIIPGVLRMSTISIVME